MAFTHLDESNQAKMVDVSDKSVTQRTATARAVVRLTPDIMQELDGDELRTPKGSVFQIAVIAGIQAAKKTAELIPLCHIIPLEKCAIQCLPYPEDCTVEVRCTVRATHKTGVEMEALTGASVAALTIYDMCKAFSHDIVIESCELLEKTGGKSDVKRG